MKYAIIGAGAIGGYYGGLLAKAGKDVHFLLKSDYEHVKKNGLIVESKFGNFHLKKVNVYNNPKDMPKCDIVIIALKTTQNIQLKEILPYVVNKGGIILVLQNGLGNEDDIASISRDSIIIGGLCFICSQKTNPGHIKHIDYGQMKIGLYLNENVPFELYDMAQEKMELISSEFRHSGIDVEISENLTGERWKKLVWNIPFSGLSVLLNADTQKIIQNPDALRLVKAIMYEVVNAADSCGYFISDDFVDQMIENTKKMAPYFPSMKLDFDNKRTIETEQLYWRAIETANSFGYGMTITEALALQLEFLNNENIK